MRSMLDGPLKVPSKLRMVNIVAVLTMDDLLVVTPERAEGSSDTVSIEVPAGKSLKIETTPGGEEYADIEVPAGKVATFRIIVSVEVVDA